MVKKHSSKPKQGENLEIGTNNTPSIHLLSLYVPSGDELSFFENYLRREMTMLQHSMDVQEGIATELSNMIMTPNPIPNRIKTKNSKENPSVQSNFSKGKEKIGRQKSRSSGNASSSVSPLASSSRQSTTQDENEKNKSVLVNSKPIES